MSLDIEQRLAAAAEAVRERELTGRHCADLRARTDEVLAEVAALRARYALEHKDVERLEGLSLSRVLASLAGSRDERLAEAQARLAAVRRDLDGAQQRLDGLAGAPAEYAAVLEEKERYLTASSNPRGRALLALAQERGRLGGEVKEAGEALQAAEAALRALSLAQDSLASASGWSTYDTFFG